MDITIKQIINVNIYVENTYEGDLSLSNFESTKSIPWSQWMQVWLDKLSLAADLATNCELSLRLTSDRQIQALNHQYRFLDNPTDVLAFAATEAEILLPQDLTEPLYLGDIVISLDTALKQARSQNHSLIVELAWLSSHGLLHLLGWDHPNDVSLQQMLNKQLELIKLLNL
ncbi:MAG: rRNA maturation RNase YbeY [Cyanobacteria bacterium P01_G01_bin.39]